MQARNAGFIMPKKIHFGPKKALLGLKNGFIWAYIQLVSSFWSTKRFLVPGMLGDHDSCICYKIDLSSQGKLHWSQSLFGSRKLYFVAKRMGQRRLYYTQESYIE